MYIRSKGKNSFFDLQYTIFNANALIQVHALLWRGHVFDAGEATGRLSLASCWRKHWLSPSGKIDSIFKRALYTEVEIQKILCILTIHPFWPRPNAFWVMYITIFEEGFIYINFFLIYQLSSNICPDQGVVNFTIWLRSS